MTVKQMYERFKLCPELKPREVCLVVEQYSEGEFTRQFHEHVPQHRLSADSLRNVLFALVVKFADLGPQTILRCHLNKRGKNPQASSELKIVTSYPEPGALRIY